MRSYLRVEVGLRICVEFSKRMDALIQLVGDLDDAQMLGSEAVGSTFGCLGQFASIQ